MSATLNVYDLFSFVFKSELKLHERNRTRIARVKLIYADIVVKRSGVCVAKPRHGTSGIIPCERMKVCGNPRPE